MLKVKVEAVENALYGKVSLPNNPLTIAGYQVFCNDEEPHDDEKVVKLIDHNGEEVEVEDQGIEGDAGLMTDNDIMVGDLGSEGGANQIGAYLENDVMVDNNIVEEQVVEDGMVLVSSVTQDPRDGIEVPYMETAPTEILVIEEGAELMVDNIHAMPHMIIGENREYLITTDHSAVEECQVTTEEVLEEDEIITSQPGNHVVVERIQYEMPIIQTEGDAPTEYYIQHEEQQETLVEHHPVEHVHQHIDITPVHVVQPETVVVKAPKAKKQTRKELKSQDASKKKKSSKRKSDDFCVIREETVKSPEVGKKRRKSGQSEAVKSQQMMSTPPRQQNPNEKSIRVSPIQANHPTLSILLARRGPMELYGPAATPTLPIKDAIPKFKPEPEPEPETISDVENHPARHTPKPVIQVLAKPAPVSAAKPKPVATPAHKPKVAPIVEPEPTPAAPQFAAPQVAAPQVAAPQVAAPQVAAPQVAAPQVAAHQVAAHQVAAHQVAAHQVKLYLPQVVTDINAEEEPSPVVAAPIMATSIVATQVVEAPIMAAPVVAAPIMAAKDMAATTMASQDVATTVVAASVKAAPIVATKPIQVVHSIVNEHASPPAVAQDLSLPKGNSPVATTTLTSPIHALLTLKSPPQYPKQTQLVQVPKVIPEVVAQVQQQHKPNVITAQIVQPSVAHSTKVMTPLKVAVADTLAIASLPSTKSASVLTVPKPVRRLNIPASVDTITLPLSKCVPVVSSPPIAVIPSLTPTQAKVTSQLTLALSTPTAAPVSPELVVSPIQRKYQIVTTTLQANLGNKSNTPSSNGVDTLADRYMKEWKPTGRFQCKLCLYSCVTHNFLFRHWVLNHCSLRPYMCGHCGFQSATRDGVTRHQTAKHRGLARRIFIDNEQQEMLWNKFDEMFQGSGFVTELERQAQMPYTVQEAHKQASDTRLQVEVGGEREIVTSTILKVPRRDGMKFREIRLSSVDDQEPCSSVEEEEEIVESRHIIIDGKAYPTIVNASVASHAGSSKIMIPTNTEEKCFNIPIPPKYPLAKALEERERRTLAEAERIYQAFARQTQAEVRESSVNSEDENVQASAAALMETTAAASLESAQALSPSLSTSTESESKESLL